MKRDRELQRLILVQVRDEVEPPELRNYSEEDILYNARLLNDDGLIHAAIPTGERGQCIAVRITDLTSKGHDFLESIGQPTTPGGGISATAIGTGNVSIGTVNIHGGDLTVGQQSKPKGNTPPELSNEARTLLNVASHAPGCLLLRSTHMGGTTINAGNKSFGELGNERSLIIWEDAINELLVREYLIEKKEDLYKVTPHGLRHCDP